MPTGSYCNSVAATVSDYLLEYNAMAHIISCKDFKAHTCTEKRAEMKDELSERTFDGLLLCRN